MATERFLSKISGKDYNNELEKILETKDFSEDVKNLLLSMLYKVENAYNDYSQTKKEVENKNSFIENILEIIKYECKKIILVKPLSPESEELEEKGLEFLVDIPNNVIKTYPNEKNMLNALYELDNKQIYVDEKYYLIRNSISELINKGKNINSAEVIRDFNGWSWNTQAMEIKDTDSNIVFQNMIMLLGYNILNDWINTNEVKDYIQILETTLIEKYGTKNAMEFLNLIYKVSIIICVNSNKREKARLLEEKNSIQEELKKMNDKTKFLEDITNIKKVANNKIKEIDKLLHDKKLLLKEFTKRNEKLSEYKKIFSLTHLEEILGRERKKALREIEEANKLLDPQVYVTKKNSLEKDLKLLKDIKLEEKEKTDSFNIILKIQKVFLRCFEQNIEKIKSKKEVIDYIYNLRYYNLIPYKKEVCIKQIKELKTNIEKVERMLIEKAFEYKVINRISNIDGINFEILKNIFYTRILKLETINIEIKKEDEENLVNIYDDKILESKVKLGIDRDLKKTGIKYNKKIKIFG